MSDLTLQDSSNGAATTITINTRELVDAAAESDAASNASPLTVRLLLGCGFITTAMDLYTALYKPPRGVLFDRHRLAYYLVLAGIFLADLAEVSAAFWLSPKNRRGHPYLKLILCASMVPLVAVVALGGFAMLVKG